MQEFRADNQTLATAAPVFDCDKFGTANSLPAWVGTASVRRVEMGMELSKTRMRLFRKWVDKLEWNCLDKKGSEEYLIRFRAPRKLGGRN